MCAKRRLSGGVATVSGAVRAEGNQETTTGVVEHRHLTASRATSEAMSRGVGRPRQGELDRAVAIVTLTAAAATTRGRARVGVVESTTRIEEGGMIPALQMTRGGAAAGLGGMLRGGSPGGARAVRPTRNTSGAAAGAATAPRGPWAVLRGQAPAPGRAARLLPPPHQPVPPPVGLGWPRR